MLKFNNLKMNAKMKNGMQKNNLFSMQNEPTTKIFEFNFKIALFICSKEV